MAAGLFETERTIRENGAKPSVTDGPCVVKKRKRVDTNPVKVKKLEIERRFLESEGLLKKTATKWYLIPEASTTGMSKVSKKGSKNN